MNTPKQPPLPEPMSVYKNPDDEWTVDAFSADDMNAHYLKGYNDASAAIQAQGVPDNRCIAELKAYATANPGTYIFPQWDGKRVAKYLASAQPAPQPAQANYLEMIYEYLVSTAPAGYADEAFREVPEEVFAADSRNRISERRASLSQHTGQLPAALGQEEVGTRQAGFDVTSAHPAPQQKPLADEQQIAEALRKHGFALVKTATGYDVMKLGPCIAHNIGEKK